MAYRILIVDDEAGIRQALKQVLEYEGMEVRTAGSGGEAITVYPDYRPHLTFLDVKMAGIDGLEAIAAAMRALGDETVRRNASRRAVAAVADLTPDAMAARLVALYESLLPS